MLSGAACRRRRYRKDPDVTPACPPSLGSNRCVPPPSPRHARRKSASGDGADQQPRMLAQMLGAALQRGHDDHRYQHPVPMGRAPCPGALQGALDKQAAGRVSGELQHDFTALRGDEFRRRPPPLPPA